MLKIYSSFFLFFLFQYFFLFISFHIFSDNLLSATTLFLRQIIKENEINSVTLVLSLILAIIF